MVPSINANAGPTATAPAFPQQPTYAPASSIDLDTALTNLASPSHLERDRALKSFKLKLPTIAPADLDDVLDRLVAHLCPDNSWEPIQASATASQYLLEAKGVLPQSHPFVASLQQCCARLIKHPEARVRESVSALIGALAATDGLATWNALLPVLLGNATDNFSLDENQRLTEAARLAARDLDSSAASAKKAHQLLHETEGWRGLETSLLAMASLVRGCGPPYLAHLAAQPDALHGADGQLRDVMRCVTRARPHPNRFVREAGLKLFDAIASAAVRAASAGGAAEGVQKTLDDLVQRVARDGLRSVQAGLQDNWSQVRFSASVAARTVLAGVDVATRHELYPWLLARMCLNRHYVAEGVRNYSQMTWRTVVASEGRVWLNRLLDDVIAFYDTQTEADNHAVREAACQGLGEAALRLERTRVQPLVGRIVAGLLRCFKDESWPVRDHACRALSDVIEAFPTEVQSVGVLDEIFELYRRHLGDNIPSVRANCAESLVKCCLAYDDGHAAMGLQRLRGEMEKLLTGIEQQKESTAAPAPTDTQYGASTKLAHDHGHDHDHHRLGADEDAAHTDQVMYSCGSLAPKLRRGGGCMDHGFTRPQEAWEMADGALQAVRAAARAGGRGHVVVDGMFARAVECGAVGWAKSFRGQTRFVESVLRGMSAALDGQVGAQQKDADGAEEALRGALRLVLVGETEVRGVGADSVRVAAKEARRAMIRVFGLQMVAGLERSLKAEAE